MHYNMHRYYDPDTGRYLTPDPLGLAGMDPNLYGYVGGNPINYIDPFGLIKWGPTLRSGSGMIGNGLGVIGGVALAAGTGGAGTVIGGIVVFKSSYGVSANFQNFIAALRDQDPVSKGSFLNDTAELVSPCDDDLQKIATAADLSIDLLSLRFSRIATVPTYYTNTGYPLLQGGGKLGPVFYGNADQYLKGLGAINAADALLQQTPYGGK